MSTVQLPPRDSSNTGTKPNQAPIWSVTRAPGADNQQNNDVLHALCSKHDRPQGICCRELKGSDERHLVDPDIVKDLIIGLSDGLTVPFALTAGLASLGSSKLVVLGGLAELFSGAISMGVGGFLGSEAEQNYFRYLKRHTHERVCRSCAGEMEREVHDVLGPLGVDQALSRRVAGALLKAESELPATLAPEPSFFRDVLRKFARTPSALSSQAAGETNSNYGTLESGNTPATAAVEGSDSDCDVGMTAFLLKFAEQAEDVPTSRLFLSAFTIAAGYALGGILPLLPYFFIESARIALYWSCAVTAVILLIFGWFKAYYTGAEIGFSGYAKGCLSTLAVGAAAAAASWTIVRALG